MTRFSLHTMTTAVALCCWLSSAVASADIAIISTTTINTNKNTTDFGSSDQPQYWPKYGGKRSVRLLDHGTWQIGQLRSIEHPTSSQSFDSMDPDFHPSNNPVAVTPNSTSIPSCVDNAPPGYLGYRGVTFFRTHFDYDLTKAPARLLFQACSFYCRVWVNGVEIGDHLAGGYVAFWLDIPIKAAADDGIPSTKASTRMRRNAPSSSSSTSTNNNELVVLVDNRFNDTTAPLHTPGDFWQYSGIMRSVELHAMPPPHSSIIGSISRSDNNNNSNNNQPEIVWPWRLYALPLSLETVKLTLHLSNQAYIGSLSGTYAFDDGTAQSFVATTDAKPGIVELGVVHVPNPRVWSIRDAQLHTITIDVNGATVTERFGLREFGVDKATSRITVNGDIVKLVGWNHHTQWPESAASPTEKNMDDDMALLQEGGTIYVRGSHYPQDPRWLDRLDEAGIVMWCETLGAGVELHNALDPRFMIYQVQQINEMMDNAMNHASIMIWGFFNEGPSDLTAACGAYLDCADTFRKRDQTRLVSYASNKVSGDICLHTADVISFNSYPGWYGHAVPTPTWNNHANNIREGKYPGSLGKPFLISETGAAGIYEWAHNKTAKKWTLALQSKVIAEDVDVAIENANISGITLWHFMDFKTDDATENNTHCDYIPNTYPPICSYVNASHGIRRPGGINHKGVIDFWRRKKPIYHVIAEKYNATRRGKVPQYWPKYSGSRVVQLLDGTWETGRLGTTETPPVAFDSMDPDLRPTNPQFATPNQTNVPSCVDNAPPGYLGYRGVSFFRTSFEYDLSAAPARLLFQACSFYCRIWVNGAEIGDHRAGGYVAFFLDVPVQKYGEQNSAVAPVNTPSTPTNELVVLVDNRFNATTAPMHTVGDYWQYSGIMRSVELHTMPAADKVWPWRLYAFPQSLSTVRLSLHLTDPTFSGTVIGSFSFDDGPAKSFSVEAKSGIAVLGTAEVPSPRLWTNGDPQLHTVIVEVDGAAVTERFGLREFGIDQATGRITLNGEIVKFTGWNHHTQWPDRAASPSEQDMELDLGLLVAAGTNYVRGSHYPQDPRWLDKLDEAGIVMWCETLGAGVSVSNATDATFMIHQKQQLNEMLDNAMNHASIMLWAFFNEGPSHKSESCAGYEVCADVIRQRDPTRFVTFASNRLEQDKCLHAADVVSFNNYPGWYLDRDPAVFWNNHANNIRKGAYPGSTGKPFLISETGAGGIYEWSHNTTAAKWTLAYQNKIIGEDVDVAIQNSNISGITLWHFFDFKTHDNTENNTYCEYIPDVYPPTCAYINASAPSGRPGGLNHKGVIDFWRRKKPIYDIVAAKYKAVRGIQQMEVELS